MSETAGAVIEAYTALTEPVRRYVLYHLADQETPVTFNSLATQVAAWHTNSEPDAVDDETLAELRTALYHVHLPKLADLDVITYENNPGSIAFTDDTDSLTPFLEPARRADFGIETPAE